MKKTWYVTRWWEAKGILELEGDESATGRYVMVRPPGGLCDAAMSKGSEACETYEEAEVIVRKRALKRVNTLKRKAVEIEKKWLSDGS